MGHEPSEKTSVLDDARVDETSPLPNSVVSGIAVRKPDDEIVNERQTTPAPPTTEAMAMTVPPTTSHVRGLGSDTPDGAFTLAPGALRRGATRLPIDVAIPTRTPARPPEDLPHRLCFLLLVVDGRSSIAEIAKQNDLPLDEVLASFVDLVGAGLVELRVL